MTTDPKDLDALIKQARDKAVSETGPLPVTSPQNENITADDNIENTTPKENPIPHKEGIAKIRTFEHDAKTAIEDTNASLARMKLAEDKKERIANNPRSSSGLFWTILIILAIIAIGIGAYLFTTKKSSTLPLPTIVTDEKPQTILAYDTIIDSELSNLTTIQNDALGTTYVRVFENETPASFVDTAEVFFGSFENIFDGYETEYMLGLYNGNMFLVADMDYKYGLPGMLSWEKQFRGIEFTDHNIEGGIFRTSETYSYIILKKGFVIIGTNSDTIQNIARLL